MVDSYNSRKAAQIAAYFAKSEGGKINILKLVKLIYLADRKFLSNFDMSMLNDDLVSMEYGPVNSRTLNRINGFVRNADDDWNAYVTDRENHFVALTKSDISDADLKELSRAELRVLKETWDAFGHMTQWELVDYTHHNCQEWEDPKGSSSPIPYERLFKALGKSEASKLNRSVALDRILVSALRD